VFRIGQRKNVVVHKFITKGTIEEKIDRMLEMKTELSENVIAGTDQSWLTEMNNEELLKAFSLTL
jgi:non-specific serine/threonine protein kinase